jgi:hypothetical protein
MTETSRKEIVDELERRIDELDDLEDDAVGRFTRLDWVICVIGAVVLPSLALIWFAE